MSLYLAYSYSTGLSKDEEIAIEKQVCRNRQIVSLYFSKFPRRAKPKIKRLCIYVMFGISSSQPLAPCAAVVLPPPTSISRLQCIDESTNLLTCL